MTRRPMKNWNLIFRRTHLYLGLVLLPWMLVYAVSTVVFNHGQQLGMHGGAAGQWSPLWEKEYAAVVPSTDADLRDFARRVLDENGFHGPFGVQRQGQKLTINAPNFLNPVRLIYDADQKKLRAEKKERVSSEVLGRLHTRVGYGRGGWLSNLWAFAVDLFCVATLAWVATGLYLWWKLPIARRWGFVTMGAGVVTFVVLLLTV
jgi:hypothetical protein